MKLLWRFALIAVGLFLSLASCDSSNNNWAVIVSTSRYFFNYRHTANALAIYKTVKTLGIPDNHIILMLAEDHACNPRNAFSGDVYLTTGHEIDYYDQNNIEIDYKGNEVTVDSFIRVLTGRHLPGTSRSVRLASRNDSNVLIYMTGHGGEGFLKFHDSEELLSETLYHALSELMTTGRANKIVLLIDTCKAASLGLPSPSQLIDLFYQKPSVGRVARSDVLPNNTMMFTSSSNIEQSYSANHDMEIGVSLIDRFTLAIVDFVNSERFSSRATFGDLMKFLKPNALKSSPTVVWNYFDDVKDVLDIKLMDVLGNRKQ